MAGADRMGRRGRRQASRHHTDRASGRDASLSHPFRAFPRSFPVRPEPPSRLFLSRPSFSRFPELLFLLSPPLCRSRSPHLPPPPHPRRFFFLSLAHPPLIPRPRPPDSHGLFSAVLRSLYSPLPSTPLRAGRCVLLSLSLLPQRPRLPQRPKLAPAGPDSEGTALPPSVEASGRGRRPKRSRPHPRLLGPAIVGPSNAPPHLFRPLRSTPGPPFPFTLVATARPAP